jgi:hypothetical protein
VQVRVLSAQGLPLTGPTDPSGSAETLDWVTDGMAFVLVDVATSRELARVSAQVACAPFDQQAVAALAAGSYFPLQVGNLWLYRVNDRLATSRYLQQRISRAEAANGKTWFVLSSSFTDLENSTTVTRLRLDDKGRVLMLNDQGQEVLWLDPTTPPDASALYHIDSRGSFRNGLGSFSDALNYTIPGFIMETGTFVRGLGRVFYNRILLAGSSGGFSDGGDLVFARISGKLIFSSAAVSLELSVEKSVLPVSTGGVTNCAVPCYFAACGITPGADPPGTYKPCFQARLRLQIPGVTDAPTVNLDLLDPSGNAVVHLSQPVPLTSGVPDQVLFRQVPLYSVPNQPLPPGVYQVRATAMQGSDTLGTATLAITLQ